MKYFLSIFLLFGIASTNSLLAQVPQAFSYQAVARDSKGICIQNSLISVRISILDSIATGPVLYTELHTETTNAQGLFSLEIGRGTALAGTYDDLADIPWSSNSKFLQVEMDTMGGNNYLLVGTSELLSVPYSVASGNGKLFSSNNRDDFFPWYGTNGEQNGILGGMTDGTGHNRGIIRLYNENGETRVWQGFGSDGDGAAIYYGSSGQPNVILGGRGVNPNEDDFGELQIRNNGNTRVEFFSNPDRGGAGDLRIRGSHGGTISTLLASAPANTTNYEFGDFRVYNSTGNSRAQMRVDVNQGNGFFSAIGPNGQSNVLISSDGSSPNHGYVGVRNSAGSTKVRMYVDANGDGIISKTISNFFMDHPHDPTKDIVYACIEGPEAAAYERGTATLIKGEAHISFSEHFEIVANHKTMTVILTPRSPDSKGLAAFEYTETGFKVKELFQGEGNYDFDWEAKAVRKGFEDYEVIRDKIEDPSLEIEDER